MPTAQGGQVSRRPIVCLPAYTCTEHRAGGNGRQASPRPPPPPPSSCLPPPTPPAPVRPGRPSRTPCQLDAQAWPLVPLSALAPSLPTFQAGAVRPAIVMPQLPRWWLLTLSQPAMRRARLLSGPKLSRHVMPARLLLLPAPGTALHHQSEALGPFPLLGRARPSPTQRATLLQLYPTAATGRAAGHTRLWGPPLIHAAGLDALQSRRRSWPWQVG